MLKKQVVEAYDPHGDIKDFFGKKLSIKINQITKKQARQHTGRL